MSRSAKKRGNKFPIQRNRVLIGITAKGETFISEDITSSSEPLIVKRIFITYGTRINAEMRSWLDATKDILHYVD